jgi:hypothetical protein
MFLWCSQPWDVIIQLETNRVIPMERWQRDPFDQNQQLYHLVGLLKWTVNQGEHFILTMKQMRALGDLHLLAVQVQNHRVMYVCWYYQICTFLYYSFEFLTQALNTNYCCWTHAVTGLIYICMHAYTSMQYSKSASMKNASCLWVKNASNTYDDHLCQMIIMAVCLWILHVMKSM